MTMKWNLRAIAAQRNVWRRTEMHQMLVSAGLDISVSKMIRLWSGRPVMVRLTDIDAICTALQCTPNDLFALEAPDMPRLRRATAPPVASATWSGDSWWSERPVARSYGGY